MKPVLQTVPSAAIETSSTSSTALAVLWDWFPGGGRNARSLVTAEWPSRMQTVSAVGESKQGRMGSNAEWMGDRKSHCWSSERIPDSALKPCMTRSCRAVWANRPSGMSSKNVPDLSFRTTSSAFPAAAASPKLGECTRRWLESGLDSFAPSSWATAADLSTNISGDEDDDIVHSQDGDSSPVDDDTDVDVDEQDTGGCLS